MFWCEDCNQQSSNGFRCSNCGSTNLADDPPKYEQDTRHRESICPACGKKMSECACIDIKHR